MATPDEIARANARAELRRRTMPRAVVAHYDRSRDRVVIRLSTGVEVWFHPREAQGLETATPSDLDRIDISPSGFSLHFPALDADLYLPALLEGHLGSERWEAARGNAVHVHVSP